jgi:hypothetical protein
MDGGRRRRRKKDKEKEKRKKKKKKEKATFRQTAHSNNTCQKMVPKTFSLRFLTQLLLRESCIIFSQRKKEKKKKKRISNGHFFSFFSFFSFPFLSFPVSIQAEVETMDDGNHLLLLDFFLFYFLMIILFLLVSATENLLKAMHLTANDQNLPTAIITTVSAAHLNAVGI